MVSGLKLSMLPASLFLSLTNSLTFLILKFFARGFILLFLESIICFAELQSFCRDLIWVYKN
ncbi:hypothetical protein BpHYR1_005752 [Brachionus plicatilis]|uniref:Uncharacterized protein n=1 Tax=Brachionus plicatilis TaxID=10195 RepID=A0A3M7QQZ8_BRAPC|nr:hypothetical protein BpHYR1_005752 [Brachionus plicatilis]